MSWFGEAHHDTLLIWLPSTPIAIGAQDRLSKEQGVQGSDTTDDDSSNDVKYIKGLIFICLQVYIGVPHLKKGVGHVRSQWCSSLKCMKDISRVNKNYEIN